MSVPRQTHRSSDGPPSSGRRAGRPAPAMVQYAALPYRTDGGTLEVMLVTSRETKRWIIPKGWPEKKVKPHELAAREAYEEAGLVGHADPDAVGTFRYDKRLKSGRSVWCEVQVFMMEVERELDEWPEKGQRERRWMAPAQAALLVQEPGLVELLLHLAAPQH